MAFVLTAGGRALLVVELPLFGKKCPLMAVVPVAGGKALHIVELPLFGKRPPLMAVVRATGGRSLLVADDNVVEETSTDGCCTRRQW